MDQIVDASIPQIQEEIVEVIQLVPPERITERIVEQAVDVSADEQASSEVIPEVSDAYLKMHVMKNGASSASLARARKDDQRSSRAVAFCLGVKGTACDREQPRATSDSSLVEVPASNMPDVSMSCTQEVESMHLFWPRVSFLVVLILCQNISSQVVNVPVPQIPTSEVTWKLLEQFLVLVYVKVGSGSKTKVRVSSGRRPPIIHLVFLTSGPFDSSGSNTVWNFTNRVFMNFGGAETPLHPQFFSAVTFES